MRYQPLLSPFPLTPREAKQFLQLAQAHRSPQAIARRARIILTAHSHPTWSSKQIAKSLDVNDRLVRKWRGGRQENHFLQDLTPPRGPRRFLSKARSPKNGTALRPARFPVSPPGLL